MNYRVLASVGAAAAIAFAQPVAFVAQEAGKAAEILGLARKAIGYSKPDTLKTFSVQSTVQRIAGSMQLNSDVEILIELPDKFVRADNINGGPGMVVAGVAPSGFNGDRALQRAPSGGAAMHGGGMMIRMGGPGGPAPSGEKPTPEQLEQMNKTMLRASKTEASRLMLGWFAMAHPAANVTYTYAGEAESADGRAYVIDVKNADNFAARLFIDEKSYLPLMVAYKGPQPRIITSDGSTPMPMTVQREPAVETDYTLFFDDWRDADGVKFPFRVKRAMAGTTTEDWVVSKVKLNPKIDAKKFAVNNDGRQ